MTAATLDQALSPDERESLWIGGGVLLLVAGLGGYLIHPLLGAGVIGLVAAPVFVLAPERALLLFAVSLPFDAVSGLSEGGSLSLTRVFGLALVGGWVVHVLVEGRRVRLTRPAWLLVAFAGLAALSLGWAADTSVTLRAL